MLGVEEGQKILTTMQSFLKSIQPRLKNFIGTGLRAIHSKLN